MTSTVYANILVCSVLCAPTHIHHAHVYYVHTEFPMASRTVTTSSAAPGALTTTARHNAAQLQATEFYRKKAC